MDNPVTAMLSYAAAVPSPLRLRVRDGAGNESEQEINAPFAIIGRGPGCDVRINDSRVSYRHAYLQAIGPRVACVDLMSVAGVRLQGVPYQGWITSEQVLQIGPGEIQLLGDEWVGGDETLKPPLEFRPRDVQRSEYGLLPKVDLELLNTQHKGMKWPINRVITLIGQDDRCRITIADDRLSRVECAFLLLPSGLWVIDLLGKGGVLLDNEPCACGMLSAGSVLTIGSYQLTAHYPDAATYALASGAFAGAGEFDFITRPNRIFQTEFYHDTLVVLPLGDSQTFFYHDIHVEANRVVDLITQRGFSNVLVDFSRVERFGHLVLEGLLNICRSAPKNAVLCCASTETFTALQISPLPRLYDHYSTRHDALQALYTNV